METSKDRAPAAADSTSSSYCGIDCSQCGLYKLTTGNDAKKKQAVFEAAPEVIKEDLGLDRFDADRMSCNTCKPGNKPLRFGLDKCAIRKCAIAKGVETCAQCRTVATCDQEESWRWFSDPRRHRLVFLRPPR